MLLFVFKEKSVILVVGVELTKDKRTAKWDDEDEEDDTMFISNSLELRQVPCHDPEGCLC